MSFWRSSLHLVSSRYLAFSVHHMQLRVPSSVCSKDSDKLTSELHSNLYQTKCREEIK